MAVAWYLAFAGGGGSGGQYVDLASRIDIQSGDDFSIFADVRIANNTTTYRMLGGDNLADTGPRVLIFGGGSFRLYNTAGAFQSWPIGVNLTTIETIEFRRVSGTLDLLINGVVQSGTKTGNTDTYLGVQVINGNGNAASENANDLYRLQFTINGVLAHDYNPSNRSLGSGTLVDDAGGNNGTLVNGGTFVEYDDGLDPPLGVTYDGGGVSAMLMSALGGASLSVEAGAECSMSLNDEGGVTVTASAGGTSDAAMSSTGGASLTAVAGGVSVMAMSAQGGATVESARPEITGGGGATVTMTATGGATVTARAGGVSAMSFSWSGGVSVSAGGGGVSVFTMTAGGGATVNEQVITVNRVTLPVAAICVPVSLPPAAMLQSVSLYGQFNYRRKL